MHRPSSVVARLLCSKSRECPKSKNPKSRDYCTDLSGRSLRGIRGQKSPKRCLVYLQCISPSTSLCERLYEPFLLKLRAAVGAFNDGEGSAALLAELLALTQLLEGDPAKALGAGWEGHPRLASGHCSPTGPVTNSILYSVDFSQSGIGLRIKVPLQKTPHNQGLRQIRMYSWRCPGNSTSLYLCSSGSNARDKSRPLKDTVSALKALRGSETETRELQVGT